MSGSISGEVKAEPNLTPLLDVVFQLITFFMLVINFSNDNYDQRVRLPVAGSARPVDAQAGEDKMVFNIDRDGKLLWNGQLLGTELAVREIQTQATLKRMSLSSGKNRLKPGEPLPTTVVLRADRDTPFSQLFSIISACQAQGYQKFAMKAMNSN
jgi:biopolymer transport protein ExbD